MNGTAEAQIILTALGTVFVTLAIFWPRRNAYGTRAFISLIGTLFCVVDVMIFLASRGGQK